ncbi:hypothetical protein JKP88DRAFT_240976 [Tribonema minus]|uniref:Uncharacterized protein n=1 Tax=Tribonema minus TaxID=303371 RepID=A0A835Z593_9STRA|nr:hypothetical protein JKP88DRAFT_240976 [Tribonema minus]
MSGILDSEDDGIVSSVLKRIKQMCSWQGCNQDADCQLHAERNARVKLFQGVTEYKSAKVRSLLIYPGTCDMVQQIFDMEPDNISSVGVLGPYIIITYFKFSNAIFRKKLIANLIPDVELTALSQGAVKVLTKDIAWDVALERDIAYPPEPIPPANMINHFEGSWRSKHVVPSTIDMIMKSMKSHSKTRGHNFETLNVLRKILEAFKNNTDHMCGCGRAECDVRLTLNGVTGFSPDRLHDYLAYGDVQQIIELVCKLHNTPVKHNATPKRRCRSESWIMVTARNMQLSYKDRMTILTNKQRKSALEKDQLIRFAHWTEMEDLIKKKTKSTDEEVLITEYNADPNYHSTETIKRILIALRDTTTQCWKCLRELIFGDDGDIDIMSLTNVAARASPDRTENHRGYTGGNTRLVCTSCNFADRGYNRSIIDDVRSTKTPDYVLTDELNELCIIYINALIDIEDTDDTDKVKTAKRLEMRKRLFPKPAKGDDEEVESDDE